MFSIVMAAILVLLVLVIGGFLWWRLFNSPDGERYLKLRTQGPFVPIEPPADKPRNEP